MFSLNTQCYDKTKAKDKVHDAKCSVSSLRALTKEIVLYKFGCLLYLLSVITLLVLFAVRAFRLKHRLNDQSFECRPNNTYGEDWLETTVLVITLLLIALSAGLLIVSLKYVIEERQETKDNVCTNNSICSIHSIDKAEDFIRRNSRSVLPAVSVNRSPSLCSNSWLNSVRTEAYETHRRLSMAPITQIQLQPARRSKDSGPSGGQTLLNV